MILAFILIGGIFASLLAAHVGYWLAYRIDFERSVKRSKRFEKDSRYMQALRCPK